MLELDERDEHPHFTERGFRVEHDYDGFDPCNIYATPWLLTRTPAAVTRPTPALGEHNSYVFGDLLGLPNDEIEALIQQGVLV